MPLDSGLGRLLASGLANRSYENIAGIEHMVARFVSVAFAGAVLFAWSREYLPLQGDRPDSYLIVLSYATFGLFGWILTNGFSQLRNIFTAAAWMSVAGLVVSLRGSQPSGELIAIVFLACAVALAWNGVEFARRFAERSGSIHQRIGLVMLEALPAIVKEVASKELLLWLAVLSPSTLKRRIKGQTFDSGQMGTNAFGMYFLLGFGLIELALVHLVLHTHFPKVALALSAASIIGLIYIFGIARSLSACPSSMNDDELVVRLGVLRSISISIKNIASCEIIGERLIDRGECVEFSIFDPPNFRITMQTPVTQRTFRGIERNIRFVEFRIGDPQMLRTAIEKHKAVTVKFSNSQEIALYSG